MNNIYRFVNVNELREEVFRRPLEQFIAVRLDDREIKLDDNCLHRMIQVADDSDVTIT